jgi:hypothetical protein
MMPGQISADQRAIPALGKEVSGKKAKAWPGSEFHRTRLSKIIGKQTKLTAQSEGLDGFGVTGFFGPLEVVQNAAATGDHEEQTATGCKILFVAAEVLGQVADALCQLCHLHVRRTSVFAVELECGNVCFRLAHAC